MNNTMVSISCLTFNHASSIKQCLDGFLVQKTNFHFEVLIHDDASTDGTVDIIRTYELEYPNIVKPVYQTENQYSMGVSPTWKYNAPRWKGEYIALCEGDDYWEDPLKLQKQFDAMKNNNLSVSFHPAKILFSELNQIEIGYGTIYENDIVKLRDYLKYGNHIPTCSLMFKKEVVKDFDYPTDCFGDICLHLHFLKRGFPIFRLNEISDVTYRFTNKGLYSSLGSLEIDKRTIKSFLNELTFLEVVLAFFKLGYFSNLLRIYFFKWLSKISKF